MKILTDKGDQLREYDDKCNRKEENKIADKPDGILLSLTQVKVLAAIRNNPNITRAEIACHLKLTGKTIDRAIYALRKVNKIKRIGSSKHGSWEIIK